MHSRKTSLTALIFSLFNLIFFHYPFYNYVLDNVESVLSSEGLILLGGLTILLIGLNYFVFYLLLYLLGRVGQWLLFIFFNISAVAVYFINSYSVIIDETMIGNVFNTNFSEASSFFSFKLILYILLLGILPIFLLGKAQLIRESIKGFLVRMLICILTLGGLAFATSSQWMWIDKNATSLGGLVMPWSYTVNTWRYHWIRYQNNRPQEPLPPASLQNEDKAVVVLVIGESARQMNFSLYGYEKETNPELKKRNVKAYKANSCATYTTAGVKCILDHKHTSDLYEPLPNYLAKYDVDVFWRTTNTGQPRLAVQHYYGPTELRAIEDKEGLEDNYDEMLLRGLKKDILASQKNKILIVLHTSTSHGPTYYKKYPQAFERFTPVCQTVEVSKSKQEELINAYDNTILYTDYFLSKLIDELKELADYKTAMLFVSDHGESLGEKALYMHGSPISIAPREQYEIPFIVWSSEGEASWQDKAEASQHNVFHTVLDFLDVDSEVYDKSQSLLLLN